MTAEPGPLARDLATVVEVPSITGDEHAVLVRLAELAGDLGLHAQLHEHDLTALRALPGYPGEEASRRSLWGLEVSVPGARERGGRRLCLNGHVDVVDPGTRPWRHGPWSGTVDGGELHGRGSVDMKGGVVAALHALAAAGPGAACEPVLMVVASEEDGGLGTFAALERDAAWDACLIPEPTGFDVVCAQAGALTFSGEVRGSAAHAAMRLEGASAIDAYVAVHAALAEHERVLNGRSRDPLMAGLELPYPISIGRLEAGSWSSSVPDAARFEGRLGVTLEQTLDQAEAELREALASHPVELAFEGARFEPGRTDPEDPFARLVRDAFGEASSRAARSIGVPYGADMRLFTRRGIPCVMAGPPGLALAHAVDERIRLADLEAVRRAIELVIARFGAA